MSISCENRRYLSRKPVSGWIPERHSCPVQVRQVPSWYNFASPAVISPYVKSIYESFVVGETANSSSTSRLSAVRGPSLGSCTIPSTRLRIDHRPGIRQGSWSSLLFSQKATVKRSVHTDCGMGLVNPNREKGQILLPSEQWTLKVRRRLLSDLVTRSNVYCLFNWKEYNKGSTKFRDTVSWRD